VISSLTYLPGQPGGQSLSFALPKVGAQPDAVLRLRSKGLPEFRGKCRGDLYLRLKLHIPEYLTHREGELYGQLRSVTG